jgi:hypothetical protein
MKSKQQALVCGEALNGFSLSTTEVGDGNVSNGK